MSRARVAVVAVVLLVVGAAPLRPAAGAAPVRQGWWRGGLVVANIDLSVLLAPSVADVPPDGLLVAGGSSIERPQAYSAIVYDLDGGTVGGPLRLSLHPGAASVPESGAMACPLDNPAFEPAQGDRMETAPAYDCFSAVPATIDDDGSYLFDVTTLQRSGVIAVAILPTAPTSRIVFAPPSAESLPVTAAAPAVTPAEVADTTPGASPAAPAFAGGLPVAAPVPAPAVVTPAAPAAPAGAAPSSDPVAIAGTRPASSDGATRAAYTLLGVAALAGGGWVFAGRDRRRPVPA